MKTVFFVPLILIFGGVECHAAEALAPQKLVGKFAFNWLADPAKQTCKPMTATFAGNLSAKRFTCASGEVSTESGLKPVTCGDPGKKVQYLVFDKKKDCEDERRNQASNE